MMARIRTIKPAFWEDELIGSLSREARLLFIACWNIADDEGLLRWTAEYLKSVAFAYDSDISTAKTAKMMVQLVERLLVFPYTTASPKQQLGFVVNFRRHQRINRPQPSSLPPPNIQLPAVKEMYGRRDRMTCGLCSGQIFEVTAPRPLDIYAPDNGNHSAQHDQKLSLDHIVPRVNGGSHYPSNIRAAHLSCNKGRRDRDGDYVPSDSVNRSLNAAGSDSLNHSPPEGKGREGKGSGTKSQSRVTSTHEGRELRDEGGDGLLRNEAGDEAGRRRTLVTLAERLVNACRPNCVEVAQVEAGAVVHWALQHVDARLLEEAIGWAEQKSDTPRALRLPRGVASTIQRKAQDRGVVMPDYDPRCVGASR